MVAQLEGAPPIHTAGPVSAADFGNGFHLVVIERRVRGGGFIYEAAIHRDLRECGYAEVARVWVPVLLAAVTWARQLIPRLATLPQLHLGQAPGVN